MGIDFSHNNAHWSYSGFNIFRERLADSIGLSLSQMAGFGGRQIPWEDIEQKDDPIIPLLNHSDCDGELTPNECKTIAPRLRELISSWPAGDYDRINASMLADGMDSAAEANEPLEFC